jgi:geranylgeranyl pyrophosphate synthase
VPPDLDRFTDEVSARIQQLAGGLSEPLRTLVSDLAGRSGKNLRPLLLRACAGSDAGDAGRLVRLGAVVELTHLASLLHDDLIDRSPVRRGGPAAHAVKGPESAVLAGLACFALVGMEAADLGGGAGRLISEAAAGLCYGELLDVERAFDTALALPDYVELIERKTGELFRMCCMLGAAEARASAQTVSAVGAFGRDFGVAFQILDDCLDFAPGGTGKPRGTDHFLGLFGAPTLYALAADRSRELTRLLLAPGFGERDMVAVREFVIAHHGLSAAERLARGYYARAMSALGHVADSEVRDQVIQVASTAWRLQA